MPRPNSRSNSLLRLEQVVKTYDFGGFPASVLNGIDLEVQEGEFIAVRGPSGAGKTTMLQIAAGLDQPTSGRVLLEGRDHSELSERETLRTRRERVGFVFQFFNLIPGLDVKDNVGMPMLLAGRSSTEIQDEVAQALDIVGMLRKSKQLASELSGGEQQRVAVARAIAHKPRVVFADEPTGNLDTRNGDAVLGLLADACRDRQAAVLMVTHEPAAAARADRIVEIRDGQLLDGERRQDQPGVLVAPDRTQT